jgi:hypothetical protein
MVFSMNKVQREICLKLRILQHADMTGDVSKSCLYFGTGHASFYRWCHAYQINVEPGSIIARFAPHILRSLTPSRDKVGQDTASYASFPICYGHEFLAKFHPHVEAKRKRHAFIKPYSPQLNGKVERSQVRSVGILPASQLQKRCRSGSRLLEW